MVPLKANWLHGQIMADIQQMTDKGVSLTSAVKRVLKKHADQFEPLFETEFEDDSEDESENEDGDQDSD